MIPLSFDRLPNELQGLLDPLLRRRVDERRLAASESLTVMTSVARNPETERYDLIITAHDQRARSTERLFVVLSDSRGSTIRAPFSVRGQAVIRGIGPAPWTTRVIRHAFDAPPLPALELNRRLPLAASFGHRELDYSVCDATGRIAVALHEDEEQHLQASLTGSLPRGALARFRWSAVGRSGVASGVLVTPVLADDPDRAIGYDLGPLASAAGVQVFPVEIIDPDDVDVDDVRSTLAYVWRGASRRAWREWLDLATPPPAVRELLGPIVH